MEGGVRRCACEEGLIAAQGQKATARVSDFAWYWAVRLGIANGLALGIWNLGLSHVWPRIFVIWTAILLDFFFVLI